MRHCRECDLSYEDNRRFCKRCGGELSAQGQTSSVTMCTSCGVALQAGARFCKKCRAEVARQPLGNMQEQVIPAIEPRSVMPEIRPSTLPLAPPMPETPSFQNTRQCQHCNSILKRETLYCYVCGKSLASSTDATAAASLDQSPKSELPKPDEPAQDEPVANHLFQWQRLLFITGLGAFVLAAAVVIWLWVFKPSSESDAANATTANGVGVSSPTPSPPMGMAYVPGGEFFMGSDTGDEYERPRHPVVVNPFFIDLNEVSREEYERFIRATGHPAPSEWKDGHYPPGTARWPVTGVDWDDANAYAKWAGKRLTTEAEWELATRGLQGNRYPWGNEWKEGLANADANSAGHMVEVDLYSSGASPYGVLNLVGNAWEWTASDFGSYEGSLLGTSPPNAKVIRGGCYMSNRSQATATFRRGWPARGGNEYDNTGFRCAKDVDGQGAGQ